MKDKELIEVYRNAYSQGREDALNIVKNHLTEYHQTICQLKKYKGNDVEVNDEYILALENIIKFLTPPQA